MKSFNMYCTNVKQVLLKFILPWVIVMLVTAVFLYPMRDMEFESFIFYDLVIVIYCFYFLIALVVVLFFREIPCRVDISESHVTLTLLRRSFLYKPVYSYTNSQILSVRMECERREFFYYIKTNDQILKLRKQCKWYEMSGPDDDFYEAMAEFKSSNN